MMKNHHSSKMRRLREILRSLDGLVVAYSGGLDSSFLAAVALQELGKRTAAVTKISPLQSQVELMEAKFVARHLGLRHILVKLDDLRLPGVARNDKGRCYYCKNALFKKLKKIAGQLEFKHVADGSNLNDLKDFRPGQKAVAESGVRSPLLEAGFDKKTIRELSKKMGLPTAGKVSESCLATRIPFGERLTVKKLSAVENMEAALCKLGFNTVRVRHHGAMARVEVGVDEVKFLFRPVTRRKVVLLGRQNGFKFICADLEGYRMGSMNV